MTLHPRWLSSCSSNSILLAAIVLVLTATSQTAFAGESNSSSWGSSRKDSQDRQGEKSSHTSGNNDSRDKQSDGWTDQKQDKQSDSGRASKDGGGQKSSHSGESYDSRGKQSDAWTDQKQGKQSDQKQGKQSDRSQTDSAWGNMDTRSDKSSHSGGNYDSRNKQSDGWTDQKKGKQPDWSPSDSAWGNMDNWGDKSSHSGGNYDSRNKQSDGWTDQKKGKQSDRSPSDSAWGNMDAWGKKTFHSGESHDSWDMQIDRWTGHTKGKQSDWSDTDSAWGNDYSWSNMDNWGEKSSHSGGNHDSRNKPSDGWTDHTKGKQSDWSDTDSAWGNDSAWSNMDNWGNKSSHSGGNHDSRNKQSDGWTDHQGHKKDKRAGQPEPEIPLALSLPSSSDDSPLSAWAEIAASNGEIGAEPSGINQTVVSGTALYPAAAIVVTSASAVPEPGTALLMILGLAGLAAAAARRRKT